MASRGRLHLRILKADLTEKVFQVRCKFCGKDFYTKRPSLAVFCCMLHRVQWHVREEKRLHPNGRPSVRSRLFGPTKVRQQKKK